MKKKPKTIAELEAMPDEAIDYSDIPPLDARFLTYVHLAKPAVKKHISLRLEPEILDWFKRQGQGYQSHINAALKAYVELRHT